MTRTAARRTAWWVLLAVLGAVIALLVWGVLSARTVAVSAAAAEEELERLEQGLRGEPGGTFAPDLPAARDAATDAREHTARAAAAATALPLTLATHVPVVGDDVRAVRAVAEAAHIVTGDVLPALLDVATVLQPEVLAADGGGIDLDALQEVAPTAMTASAAARRATALLADVDPGGLLDPVRGPVGQARNGLTQLADVSTTLAGALTVLPKALGAEGPQRYLLAFQNLAEARPTGGIIGAWALLEADQGQLRLLETGVNDDLEKLAGPVRDLGTEMRSLYGSDLRRSQNVNLSPHFPHAAVLLSDLWVQQGREAPDGVIGVDPVALSELLEATGPVDVPGGPGIDADSVVNVVQADAYETFQHDKRGRLVYLSAVPAAVFDAVVRGGLADPQVLDAIISAARDRHLQIWSADEDVQAVAEQSGIAGALSPPDGGTARVHVTNIDASKLDHYLRMDVSCRQEQIVIGLTSAVPDAVPPYVANHLPGADPTTHQVVLDLFLPPDRGVATLDVDGEAVDLASGSLRGWIVARAVVELPPGRRVEASWRLLGEEERPEVVVQPMTTSPDLTGCGDGNEL